MIASAVADLCARAQLLGVPLHAAQAEKLLRLLDELEQWNRAYNLTAIDTREAMITQHLLDSLAGSGELRGARIADLGTGAGFPGLPLALLHPQREFTLIDSTAKKIRFVAHAARALGLRNVHPLHVRAETLRPERPFDTVVARAPRWPSSRLWPHRSALPVPACWLTRDGGRKRNWRRCRSAGGCSAYAPCGFRGWRPSVAWSR